MYAIAHIQGCDWLSAPGSLAKGRIGMAAATQAGTLDGAALAARLARLRGHGRDLERWPLVQRNKPPLSVMVMAWPLLLKTALKAVVYSGSELTISRMGW